MKEKQLSILDVTDRPEWMYNYKFTLWDEIVIEFKHIFASITGFWHNLTYGIKNLIYYFPVIWNDRHWDYEFMLDLLERKIKQMRDGIKKDNILAKTDEYVKQMNDALWYITCFKEAWDRFEMMSQNRLKEIQDETDEKVKDKMVRQYYIDSVNYENEQWDKIWDIIKEYGRHWWN